MRALLSGQLRHVPRTFAEETDSFKQVITYVLITHGANVLSFRRGTFNRAAAFLRGSRCIGFGGHVAESDLTIFSYGDAGITGNAIRELSEELVVPVDDKPKPEELKIVGLINDDSSAVGRRHLGVVFRYEPKSWSAWEKVTRGEASINELGWINALEQTVNLIEYEYWSQLCWRTLFPVMVRAQPSYKIIRKKPFRGKHILVVVGGMGSGKSLTTWYLSKSFGYTEINSGRVLAQLLRLPPVPQTPRSVFQEKAWAFIQHPGGPASLADAIITAAKRSGQARVVIDGIRQRATLNEIRMRAGLPVAVLFVHAAPDLAYALYTDREQQRQGALDPSSFMRLLSAEVEADVPFMMSEADAVIYNWSGEAGYGHALGAMAEELGIRWREENPG